MGNMGKVFEREQARIMRAQGAKLIEICQALKVSKSSASVWVRDVPFVGQKRAQSAHRRPHGQAVAKQKEIQAGIDAGHEYFAHMSRKEFFAAGIALYAGEGTKGHQTVCVTNTDPLIITFYLKWLREFFAIDESRLRVGLYLHENLDLDSAIDYWSRLTDIPLKHFIKPYRATADPARKRSKHVNGCISVRYHCVHTARKILGYMDGLLEYSRFPG
ncbi:MAG TPA: hypothetical protein PKB15_03035 [Acidimicrobiia bacterium]|nr:hypothetical protein [Acidimicrobiia bacterium]